MSEEKTIKLNEKRYSLRTAAMVLELHPMTVYKRAKNLGIDTSRGIAAADVRLIEMYAGARKHNGPDELRREMGRMK